MARQPFEIPDTIVRGTHGPNMAFPIHRKRRLRVSEAVRSLVRETHLEPSQFVLPLFTCPGEGVRKEISSMPGNYQLSIDELVKAIFP